jgi:hypothetical protein
LDGRDKPDDDEAPLSGESSEEFSESGVKLLLGMGFLSSHEVMRFRTESLLKGV